MNFQTSKSTAAIPPLFIPLIAYVLSLALYWNMHLKLLISVVSVSCALLVVALYTHGTIKKPTTAFLLAIMLLGPIRIYQIEQYYESFPYHITKKGASIQATLQEYSYLPNARFSYCSTLLLEKIGDVHYTYTIQLYTQHKLAAEIGDLIEINNITLKKPANNSFYSYLIKSGIAATAFEQKPNVHIVSHDIFSMRRWLFSKRKELLYSFKKRLTPSTFQLFAAIFLGEKEFTKKNRDAFEKPFKKWGIIHYLARSGLHLVIIISLCAFFLRFIPIRFELKQLALLFIIIAYSFLSWSSVSFLRAFVIFLMYSYCHLLRIPAHFLHLLLACCFLFLIYNPFYILFLDFQLSFGLTFALAWLNLFRTVPTAHY